MTDDEVWTDCPGFEGRYQVSDQGRVMNTRTGRVLVPTRKTAGLSQVTLYRADGSSKDCLVGRLVCTAFHGPPPPNAIARHNNEMKTDDRAANLSWRPPSQPEHRGAKNPNARLSEANVLEMRQRSRAGVTYTQLATEYGVSVSAAHAAVIGRTWKHLPDAPAVVQGAGAQ